MPVGHIPGVGASCRFGACAGPPRGAPTAHREALQSFVFFGGAAHILQLLAPRLLKNPSHRESRLQSPLWGGAPSADHLGLIN